MLLLLGLGTSIADAQNSANPVPLGDLARELKVQRAKSEGKPKVFTNDDIATLPALTEQPAQSPAKTPAAATEAQPGQQFAKPASGKLSAVEPAKAGSPETGGETHGEKYFRDRMSKLREQLDMHERELSVLQQQLGQNQMMYYPDPNQGLLQESGPTAMSDVYKLQDQIAEKKEEIAADQEAIDDLREQLRREGGDPGWFRLGAETNQETESGQATGKSEKPEAKNGTKEYWQAKFKSARARLADAKEGQQLAEDELNLLQIQAVRELDPNLKADLAGKIQAKEDEISARQAATEEAEKALEDLQNEFKATGQPDEWSETETIGH
jgi:hypothetical protein